MTYEEKIKAANNEISKGNWNHADVLANEVLRDTDSGEKEHGLALYVLAESARMQSKYAQAREYSEQLLLLGEKYNREEVKPKAWNNLGIVNFSIGNYPKALEYFSLCLVFNEKVGDASKLAICLGNIGNVYSRLGDHEKVMEYYIRAIALHEQLDEQSYLATVTGNLGVVYFNCGDYGKAVEHFTKALSIHEKFGEKQRVASMVGNLGNVYTTLGDYSMAIEYLLRALSVHEELGDKSNAALVMVNLGGVYKVLEEYEKVFEYFFGALAICEELAERRGIARVTGTIGTLYVALGDNNKALEYLLQSLEINEEIGEKMGITTAMGNIGSTYFSLQEFAKSLEYFQNAHALAEEIGASFQRMHWLAGLGKLYAEPLFEQYSPTKAEKYLRSALDESNALGIKLVARDASLSLYSLYKKQRKWKLALEIKEKHDEIEKEINVEEAKKKGNQLEFERKQAEREKEIAVERAKHEATEALLHNVLPQSITQRLLRGEQPIADRAEEVSVFFSDIVGFTLLSQKITAKELVSGLNELFTRFDTVAKKHGVEKIKTIGDSYMAVCGIPIAVENHAERMARFALEIQTLGEKGLEIAGYPIMVRIGLHCGEVVAGVIGEQKFAYDLWGDAVNTASRMESHGEPGKIHVSEEFAHALVGTGRDLSFPVPIAAIDAGTGRDLSSQERNAICFIERGELDIKGKGMMKTYFLTGENK